MNTELLNKLDATHVSKFKLSENSAFSINQNYICELFDIIEYYKLINRLNTTECEIMTDYIASLYSRIKQPVIVANKTDTHTECKCCSELNDNPYRFCFNSSLALIKCKNFQMALKHIPLLELFLVYTTDFYKDTKSFKKTIFSLKRESLAYPDVSKLLSNMFNAFNNYDIRSKFIIIFILVEYIINDEYCINNKKMAQILNERIGDMKKKISEHMELRILYHDIITRCKLPHTILDEWLSIC